MVLMTNPEESYHFLAIPFDGEIYRADEKRK